MHMAAVGQISTGMSVDRTLSSSRNLVPLRRTLIGARGRSSISLRQCSSLSVRSIKISEDRHKVKAYAENGAFDVGVLDSSVDDLPYKLADSRTSNDSRRKTKIVCTIGPSSSSREMIWKLAEAGMNVARLNMSHGDHASHQKTIDLVKEYNSLFVDKAIAIMLDTKLFLWKDKDREDTLSMADVPGYLRTCLDMGKIAFLAILVSTGIVLQVLACALFNNWWPMLSVIMYVLLPMPLLFFGGSDSTSLFSESDNSWINAAKFLTGASAVGSVAIPSILKHAGLIGWGALAFDLSSYIVFLVAILGYICIGDGNDNYYSYI